MDLYENSTHSFIIKIWLEEGDDAGNGSTWRGHITHVSSGKRRYIQELDAILAFISPYLKQMGVDLSLTLRLRLWWRRWRRDRRRVPSGKDKKPMT